MASMLLDMAGEFDDYTEETISRRSEEWAKEYVGVNVACRVHSMHSGGGGHPEVEFRGAREDLEKVARFYWEQAGDSADWFVEGYIVD